MVVNSIVEGRCFLSVSVFIGRHLPFTISQPYPIGNGCWCRSKYSWQNDISSEETDSDSDGDQSEYGNSSDSVGED